MVRVVNKELEQRTLIRGMRGLIQDLSFAHVSNPILACVDYTGSLFVYSIEATSAELLCTRVLQVDADDPSPMSHRVIWCPYIPEEEVTDGDEVSKFLVLTRGSKAELWSIAAASRLFNAPIKVALKMMVFLEGIVLCAIWIFEGLMCEFCRTRIRRSRRTA